MVDKDVKVKRTVQFMFKQIERESIWAQNQMMKSFDTRLSRQCLAQIEALASETREIIERMIIDKDSD